ncbi:MAG: exosortase family protein XrtM [Nevskia sp.]|nr:exosortase family protein XrtM [Nevskia sp.]
MNWTFALVFATTYIVLYVAYSLIPDSWLADFVYNIGIVGPAKVVVNGLAPTEHTVGVHNRLESARATLSIVRGCDGSGVIFLLIAAIVAYRSSWKRTLLGLLGAVMLISLLNLIRIVVLYFIQAYHAPWFESMHVYFIPTATILLGTLYFALWTARVA